MLAQSEYIVPLFGTKRRQYLEENIRALEIELTPADLEQLDEVAPKRVAAGERCNEASMRTIDG